MPFEHSDITTIPANIAGYIKKQGILIKDSGHYSKGKSYRNLGYMVAKYRRLRPRNRINSAYDGQKGL